MPAAAIRPQVGSAGEAPVNAAGAGMHCESTGERTCTAQTQNAVRQEGIPNGVSGVLEADGGGLPARKSELKSGRGERDG